jgi:hypothetical protein
VLFDIFPTKMSGSGIVGFPDLEYVPARGISMLESFTIVKFMPTLEAYSGSGLSGVSRLGSTSV